MARLPVPGGDDGTWGDVLNQFLLASHDADGTLSSSAVGAALPDNSVTNAKIVTGTISEAKLDSAVQTKLNAGSSDPIVGGDLSGTASNAQIVAGAVGATELASDAVTDSKVSATANIAQSKIANLTSDLAGKANTSHTHAIADVTNLQTTLDAKVDDSDPRLSDQRVPTDGSVTALKLASDSVTEPKLDAANAPSNGQVLSWNGTNFTWVNQTTVSGYVQGDGIAKITVGATQPTGPAIGDVWITTS